MKKLLDIFRNNVILKITSLNGVSVLLRALIGIVTSKLVAIYIGPQGMALLGNFRNFFSSVQTLSTLGLSNGVVKYVAELKSNIVEKTKFFATLFFLGSIASLVVGCVLYFGATYWNQYVFGASLDFRQLFQLLGILLPCYVVQMFLLSIVNGLSKYKTYIYINIIGNSLYGIAAVFLIVNYRLTGALFTILMTPLLLLVVTLVLLGKEKFTFSIPKLNRVSVGYIKKLSAFALMALFSGLVFPQVMLQIRKHLISTIGEAEAGIWEGLQQLSSHYLLFVTSLFTLYLLPKLSENQSDRGFKNIVLTFYKSILPILAIGLVVIYFLRTYIITLLFSEDFLPMESLFIYQLLGDFLRIISLTLAYQLIAKKMLWKYLLTEGISMLVIYSTSIYCVNSFGFVGVTQAHLLSYMLYLGMLVVVFRRVLFVEKEDV